MATKVGTLKDRSGDIFLPETDASLVSGLATVATSGSYNDLSNKPDLSGFITSTVNNLTNYYLKSETYSQAEVDALVNAIHNFSYEAVSSLPVTPSASTMYKIYLVPSANPETQNVKDEYITVESNGSYSWEQIGSTAIDLSGYQPLLTSGTNIKTIAGQSLLGSGDVVYKVTTTSENPHIIFKQDNSHPFCAIVTQYGGANVLAIVCNAICNSINNSITHSYVGAHPSGGNAVFIEFTTTGTYDILFIGGDLNVAPIAGKWTNGAITDSAIRQIYNIPSTGIPKSDLSSGVSDILDMVYTDKPSFGGLFISPGPLMYNGTSFEIKDDWTYNSFKDKYGLTAGSTYFSFNEMGALFEKNDFDSGDGDIENILDPFNGWRLPTRDEIRKLVGVGSDNILRVGATVNGEANKHFAFVKLTDYTFDVFDYFYGVLFFPDNRTITGETFTEDLDSARCSELTTSQLNVYLNQGCIFYPAFSACLNIEGTQTWADPNSSSIQVPIGMYIVSEELVQENEDNGPNIFMIVEGFICGILDSLLFDNIEGDPKDVIYTPILLVKFADIVSDLKNRYYKPSFGIPASDLAPGVVPQIKTFAGKSLTYQYVYDSDLIQTFIVRNNYTVAERDYKAWFRVSDCNAIIYDDEGEYAIIHFDDDFTIYDYNDIIDSASTQLYNNVVDRYEIKFNFSSEITSKTYYMLMFAPGIPSISGGETTFSEPDATVPATIIRTNHRALTNNEINTIYNTIME